MRRSLAACAVVVLGGVLSAHAATVLQVTLEQMTQRSPIVVRGKVVQQQVHVPEGSGRVYTDTEIQVTETFKSSLGPATPGSLLVRQPGGVANGVLVEVDGAARFAPGEDVVLFLSPAARAPGVFIPFALSASKVSLVQKPDGLHAVRRLDGLAFVTPGPDSREVRPVGGEEDLGRAETFFESLRQWASVPAKPPPLEQKQPRTGPTEGQR